MKRLSIKLRITLWFALFMVVLCAVMLVFISLVSRTASSHENNRDLIAFAERNAKRIAFDNGEPKADEGFDMSRNGMYYLVFGEDGTLLSGIAPSEELQLETFENETLRTITTNDENFLIYDMSIKLRNNSTIWLRTFVSTSGTGISQSALYSAALIAFPLLILFAIIGGYIVAKNSLRPINEINKTAEEIGRSGDLSKRIELSPNGDELHMLANTFNRMFERLEQNLEAERSFTSDASHELRTPVATILAQCEYAFENADGEDELYESLGVIQKQGFRMNRLIESLLQFTRIEQRTEKIEMLPIDFSLLVSTVCQEQRNLSVKNIELSDNIQPEIHLTGNATLLIRLLENLIRNAYRYGKEDGNINVTLKEAGNQAILSVADDGIGISENELSKIWTRFYRVDKARKTSNDNGLGLGLAMVRQIAELHNAEISVESALDKGSTFTIRFTTIL